MFNSTILRMMNNFEQAVKMDWSEKEGDEIVYQLPEHSTAICDLKKRTIDFIYDEGEIVIPLNSIREDLRETIEKL